MDPNERFEQLLDAMMGTNIDEAASAYDDLVDWIGKGGFPPVMTGKVVIKLYAFAMQMGGELHAIQKRRESLCGGSSEDGS